MKYLEHKIVFKEHPEHISLLIPITNCPYRCKGCHSPELQDNSGELFDINVLKNLIVKYYGHISNVIFFGGDQYEDEFVEMLRLCKDFDLKTTLWTGALTVPITIWNWLDYLKTGPYIPEFGPIGSPTTNQRYIDINTRMPIKIP